MTDFKPDYTPQQLIDMGVINQVYGDSPSLASLDKWPEHWLDEQDPLGWLQWYTNYDKGRKSPTDEKQIKRWKSFKARHGKQLQQNPTPRRAYALRNWAIDPAKLLENPKAKKQLLKAMKEYKEKKLNKQSSELPEYFIDRPKGYKKTFNTLKGKIEKEYPVNYGYLNNYVNPDDEEELDVFIGSGGNNHGRFMKGQTLTGKWLPDERKWYANLTNDELKQVIDLFESQHKGLLQDYKKFKNLKDLIEDIEPYKMNKTAQDNKETIKTLLKQYQQKQNKQISRKKENDGRFFKSQTKTIKTIGSKPKCPLKLEKESNAYQLGKQASLAGDVAWEGSKFVPVAGALPAFWDAGKALLNGKLGTAGVEGLMGILSLASPFTFGAGTGAAVGLRGALLAGKGLSAAGKAGKLGSMAKSLYSTGKGINAANAVKGTAEIANKGGIFNGLRNVRTGLNAAAAQTPIGQGYIKGVDKTLRTVGKGWGNTVDAMGSGARNLGSAIGKNKVGRGVHKMGTRFSTYGKSRLNNDLKNFNSGREVLYSVPLITDSFGLSHVDDFAQQRANSGYPIAGPMLNNNYRFNTPRYY